ncbi:hypothetical protein [uncultured Zobellia sp.]|uniref:beta strand repeat-containing protein n=1 Tax=uncultured Zobellia sp. TaxID=255433 RepID=UPI0025985302|nr:hypothetical protein [uncultured Zobellia sp.]
MQKRISIPLFFVGFFLISFAQAQVKIGDNPQTIDPASILELESSDKVLVITRVDSLQMTTIVPNRGALVYNTTADCVYYYDGAAWISMCEGADGGALTATPIVNSESTIVITPTAGGNNFEIAPNSITSDQILNGGINGVDIQNGSIGRGKLAPNAVDKARIAQNAVGPYAIDRDSLGLSFFNNDAGFITGANVVSGDADNSISVGSDSGAFFDATTLEDNIAANTAAIAADGDGNVLNEIQILNLNGATNELTLSRGGGSVILPTSSGSDTKIANGTNTTVTGTGIAANPYQINVTPDGDGNSTNELITNAILNASDELIITDAGQTWTIPLGGLAGSTGSNNSTFIVANDSLNITDGGGTLSVPLSQISNGTGSNNTSFTVANDSLNIADGGGVLSVPLSGIGNANNTFEVANDSLVITDNSGPLKIALSEIAAATGGSNNTLFQVANDSLQITDGDGTLSIPLDSLTQSLTPKAIFFADTDGTPTTTDNNTNINDNGGFIWDTDARPVGSQTYGALLVGKQAGSPTLGTHAKVVITERIANGHPTQSGLAYPLQIQNENDTSTGEAATGILFAVDRNEDYGKGALAYERLGNSGQGDFHFLQNTAATTDIPTLADKAFTVKNNGDIVLYKGIEIGGVLGDDGQVLTSTGTGVAWEDAGAASSFKLNDVELDDALVMQVDSLGYNIITDNNTITIQQDSLKLADGAITLPKLSQMGAADKEVLQWNNTTGEWETNLVTASAKIIDNDPDDALLVQADSLGYNIITDNNTITIQQDSLKLADGAITLPKLAQMGAADKEVLQWNNTTDEWETNLVTASAKIIDNDPDDALLVQTDSLGYNINTDNITLFIENDSLKINNDGITSLKIKDGEVKTADIAAGAVVTNSIANDNVTPDKISQGTDGQILTTNGTDVAWANAQNLAESDLTQTANRSYDLNGNDLLFTGSGRIGIGLSPGDPLVKLRVNGQVRGSTFRSGDGTLTLPAYRFESDQNSGMYLAGTGELGFITSSTEAMRIDAGGNVGIGTDTPAEKLHVTGNIQADGSFISATTTYPDYVFEKYFQGYSNLDASYKFLSLEEVETYLQEKFHLPGIKSASEISENEGNWNLTEGALKNLEKIEELFLHTIEQEKEIKKLKAEKEAMAKELKSMKNDIEEIKALLNK